MTLIPKRYSKQSKSDTRSISIIEDLLDEDFAISHLNKHDKIPNHDGHIELINKKGVPIGEIKTQVKTLRKGAQKISHPVDMQTFIYAESVVQIPFVYIVVDQNEKKAYWRELDRSLAQYYISKYHEDGGTQDHFSIEFESANEIGSNPPYELWVSLIEKLRNDLRNISRVKNVSPIKINDEAHALVQFEELFEAIYSELSFIPIHILTQQYPLREKYNSRYNSFVLNTYNDNLRSFFEAVEIDNQRDIRILDKNYFKGLKNPEERISKVLQKFTSNLIYYIRNYEHRDYIDMRCFVATTCSCARCQIEKYSFETLDFSIEVKDTRIDELLNKAYGHYKMGHFKKTYRIYKEAIELAVSKKRNLTVFLIEYNLSHLAYLLETNYYDDHEAKEIVRELRDIDVSAPLYITNDPFHREIQEWMLNDHYMKHFHTRISEIKQQLIDHYHSSVNGGSGSNNYVNELVNQYSQLHQFLQQNTIIIDCFKSYHDIVEMVIEGLFASYAVEGNRSSKIDSFNDWLLSQIIKFGRTRSIRRLANRYKIRELHYANNNEDHDSVKTQVLRLFEQFEVAHERLITIEEPNYNYFNDDYRRWLNNALYITSLVDFDKSYIVQFTDALISFIKRKTHNLDTIEVVSFLVRKFQLFTSKQRRELLLIGIRDEQLMRSYFLLNFASLCEEENKTFTLPKKDLNLIVSKPFNQMSNIVSLVHVHRCLSDASQKKIIQDKVKEELDDSFRLDVWNSAVLYEVIPLIENDLAKAIDILTPKKDVIGSPVSFSGGARNNGGLDELINVCYNWGVDLADGKFDGLRKYSPYYEWLLDVDGFDYSKFESSWLMEYGTEPYMRRFSKSKVLKEHISYLLAKTKEKNKESLKQSYMEIFVLK